MKNSNKTFFVDQDMPCIPSNYSRLIARELGLQVRDLAGLLADTSLSVDTFLEEDALLLQATYNSLRSTD